MFIVLISLAHLGAKQAIGFHWDDGHEVRSCNNSWATCHNVSLRLMYVRNASGLVMDGAKLLHILVILFLVIYFSNRNIFQIIIRNSSKGSNYTRNICMKTTTPVLPAKFLISAYIHGFLYDLVLTFCYLIALKERYKQIFHGCI